jgi:hypothetical protein
MIFYLSMVMIDSSTMFLPCFSFFISFLSGDNVLTGKTVEVIEACTKLTGLMLFVGDEVISTDLKA